MALDIELYRRTIYTSADRHAQKLRRIGVIDIHPEGATRTLVLVHGYGGSATQWLYQLQFFGWHTQGWSGDRILEAIKNYHPTIFPGIPALYHAIANYLHLSI